MAWNGLTLTIDGRSVLTQAQVEKKLAFKSIVVGDGGAPQNFNTVKSLVHQLYEITEIMVDVSEDRCVLTADFPNVAYDYYFREVGVMVKTEDGEKLYVYDNCGDDAQYIASANGLEQTRKRIRLSLKISDVEEITIENPEILYVSYDDFDNLEKTVKEKVTAKGGDVSDTQVTEITPSEEEYPIPGASDTLKVIMGKLIKFCNDVKAGFGKKADSNHTHADATQSANGLMSAADKTKLDGVADKANNYSHPSTHAATMISQDSTHRFVTDTEKSTWNGKANASHTHSNYASSSHTHNYAGSASAGGSATSADKAAKLSTARTITIGSKGKSFDGSANVSFTLDEIGAFPNKRSGMSTQGQDFDNFTSPGFYEIGVDNGFDYAKTKHAPKINSWGFLLVFNSGWVCLQIYIPFKTDQYVDSNLRRYMPRAISYSGGGSGNYYSGVTVKECEGQRPAMAIRSKWGTGSSAAWSEWRYIWGSAWDGTGVFGKTE